MDRIIALLNVGLFAIFINFLVGMNTLNLVDWLGVSPITFNEVADMLREKEWYRGLLIAESIGLVTLVTAFLLFKVILAFRQK